jgi:hypothetical protein
MEELSGQTLVHPLAFAMLLLSVAFIVTLPRRVAFLPVLALLCLVPTAQRIVIAGLDFHFVRILAFAGILRLIIWREYVGFAINRLDYCVVAYAVVSLVAYGALYQSASAVIFKLGTTADVLGMFAVMRCMIRDRSDVLRVATALAVLALLSCPIFLFEWTTGRNMFAVFGGVPEMTAVRDGRLRCQGPFAHPILAGCFYAASVPLIAGLFSETRGRLIAVGGIVGAVSIVLSSASATPLGSLVAAAGAMMLFRLRFQMQVIRWTIFIVLLLLHLVMAAPVWHLIARVGVVGGATGWHRFLLIDGAINHLTEWWLIGTTSTAHWGRGLGDITNQFILEGVRGGLISLFLFTLCFWTAFSFVGRAAKAGTLSQHWPAWTVGASLATHMVSFMGVSYFGQIMTLIPITLALAAAFHRSKQDRHPRRKSLVKHVPDRASVFATGGGR